MRIELFDNNCNIKQKCWIEPGFMAGLMASNLVFIDNMSDAS